MTNVNHLVVSYLVCHQVSIVFFSSYQSAVCFISGGTKVGCMLVQEYLEGQTSKKRVKMLKTNK